MLPCTKWAIERMTADSSLCSSPGHWVKNICLRKKSPCLWKAFGNLSYSYSKTTHVDLNDIMQPREIPLDSAILNVLFQHFKYIRCSTLEVKSASKVASRSFTIAYKLWFTICVVILQLRVEYEHASGANGVRWKRQSSITRTGKHWSRQVVEEDHGFKNSKINAIQFEFWIGLTYFMHSSFKVRCHICVRKTPDICVQKK